MIFIQWPLMLAALVPVILVEAILIRRWLPLSYRDAFLGAGRANVYSTAVGIPMAWGIMFLVDLALMLPLGLVASELHWQLDSPVFQAVAIIVMMAWEVPGDQHVHWIIPMAVALLLIPSFFVSVGIERRSYRRPWPAADPIALNRGVYFANLWSYAALFIMACAWLGYQVLHSKPS